MAISSIQNDFWANRSLGAGAERTQLPNKVALRTLSQARQEMLDLKAMDNDPARDSDPRDGYVSYRTDYWATPSETATKTVSLHLDGNRLEATHTRDGADKPFEYYSSVLEQNTLTTLALIPGPSGVTAIANFITVPGESFRDRKTF